MRQIELIANLVVLFASVGLYGQNSGVTEAPGKTSSSHATTRDSATTKAELTELHRIEAARTSVQITQAQADEHEEDIFIFTSVLDPGFTAEASPFTASLSALRPYSQG